MATTLKLQNSDGVKVYSVAGGKIIPSWLSESKKKQLRKDEEYRKRIELIQDFEFPSACQRIKITPDGQYIFATGYHAPRVRVYDLSQLSMKFERYLDAEIVDFQILSDDYAKAVFLCADRTLHFHAKFGAYYQVRVPRFGRDLAYSKTSADLLVSGSAPEVYRLDLAEGRFMSPLQTRSQAVNACGIAPAHGLFACAGDDGGLECFDLRQRESLGWMNAAAAAGVSGQELTSLRFDDNGLQMAVGTSGGVVAVFDLRSSKPLITKDHMYDSAIVDIKFQTDPFGSGQRHVVSSDRHIIKIWDADTGEAHTNIEPGESAGEINDVALRPDSGLLMAACDSARIQAYFVPSLGPAPTWCNFLENLTEEMEENTNVSMYDDYRFVTKSELEKLGLSNLVGTKMLRAYMHGFFLDNRLYNKAKAISDPFAYETYRKKKIEEKLEDERRSRIGERRKLPKVNAATAAKLILESESKGAKKLEVNLLDDNRFSAMFQDPEFAIDFQSEDYRQLHPNTDPAKDKRLLAEHFDELDDDDGDDGDERDDDDASESEQDAAEDGFDGVNVPAATARPKMYVAKDAKSAKAFKQGASLESERTMSLAERAKRAGAPSRRLVGGDKEVSFTPRTFAEKKKKRGGGGKPSRGRKRR